VEPVVNERLHGRGERPEGWEVRLVERLRDASTKSYDARHWNCARFAHGCACAVAGREFPFAWKGSLEASVDAVLPRIGLLQARRGDIVLADVPEASLGVCVGAMAAFVTSDGLLTRPLRDVRAAWSV
jgi:hypothetical protein